MTIVFGDRKLLSIFSSHGENVSVVLPPPLLGGRCGREVHLCLLGGLGWGRGAVARGVHP